MFHLFVVWEGTIQEWLFLRSHPLFPQSRLSSDLDLIKEASVADLKPQGVYALTSQYWDYCIYYYAWQIYINSGDQIQVLVFTIQAISLTRSSYFLFIFHFTYNPQVPHSPLLLPLPPPPYPNPYSLLLRGKASFG